jgi:hypothetical protein
MAHTYRLRSVIPTGNDYLAGHLVFINKSSHQHLAKCDGCDGLNQKSDGFQKLRFDPSQATPPVRGCRSLCVFMIRDADNLGHHKSDHCAADCGKPHPFAAGNF